MRHEASRAGRQPARKHIGWWLRALGAACLVTLLAYGCSNQDCRKTFTCADTEPLTDTNSNQPDASLNDDAEPADDTAALQACPQGEHSCPSGCASNADPLSCGTSCTPCDVPIDGRATCDGLRCGGACEQGKTLCFGACIPEGEPCTGTCGEGTHDCSGLCASDDSVNACGASCDPCPVPENALQASCVDGACGFVCMLGYHRCGDTCQRDTNVDFCGPACEPCAEIENGFPACNNRICTVWCEPGFHVCDEQCVPNDSPDSCGETSCTPCTAPAGGTATCNAGVCGTQCPEGEKLCAGVCISVDAACSGLCPEGTHNCNESCVPNDSAAQCGVDCVSCDVPLGATTATCVDGQCGIAGCREPGFRQCGDMCPLVDSVEACGPQCELCSDDPNDPDAERACQNDECGILCSTGFHLCDDGCRGDTDVDACGPDCAVCAAPEGGSVSCINGACVPACPNGMKLCTGVCIPNAEACDGQCPEGTHNCSNFCVDDALVTSCGTRCTACPAPPDFGAAECIAGACDIVCDPGFHSCVGECAPDSDPNRCGDTCQVCTVTDTRTQRPACQAGECVSQCLGTAEVCDATGLDEDCDGEVNEGCDCIPGTPSATSTCDLFYAAQDPLGVCATRSLTCSAAGQFPTFNAACTAQTSEVCDATRLDDDCDGQANEGCTCAEGQTITCGALYPTSQGSCAARPLTCSAAGTWPAQNGNCTPAAGTQDSCTVTGDDSNCNGVPNDACTCTAPGGTVVPTGGTVSCGPCGSGTRTCQGGTLLPCNVPDVACAGCCNGNGTTATCTANGATNASACGTGGEACTACPAPSSGTGSATCGGGNCGITCTNGLAPVSGACPQCAASAQTSTCGAVYPTVSASAACQPIACLANGSWPAQATACAARDESCSTPGDDNCNGTANEGCDCVDEVGNSIDEGDSIPCGACNTGQRTCTGGILSACQGETTLFVTDFGPRMRCVEAGETVLGTDQPPVGGNPAFTFSFTPTPFSFDYDFWMDETEVTVAQYDLCVSVGSCPGPSTSLQGPRVTTGGLCNYAATGKQNHPMNCMDEGIGQFFCSFAGKRLPTEAEWEYAARGQGTLQSPPREFPWGAQAPDASRAHFNQGAFGTVEVPNTASTTPARSAGRTPSLIYDLAGNVREFTTSTDCFTFTNNMIIPLAACLSGTNPGSDVHRGSSFQNDGVTNIGSLQSAARAADTQPFQAPQIGFRCVLTAL